MDNIRLLISGTSGGRETFFTGLLSNYMRHDMSLVVLDVEGTALSAVQRICGNKGFSFRTAAPAVDYSSMSVSDIASAVCEALAGDGNINPALLYRFVCYVAEAYKKNRQKLTVEEFADITIAHMREAFYHLYMDDADRFTEEYAPQLMGIENALIRYGSMHRNNIKRLTSGECTVFNGFGNRTGSDDSSIFTALHSVFIKTPSNVPVCCIQWGISDTACREMLKLISGINGNYVLFGRDIPSALSGHSAAHSGEILSCFDQVVLLRHSSPESCKHWAELIGKKDVWRPTVSQTDGRKGLRLIRPLPLPSRQGTVAMPDRQATSLSITKEEGWRINPWRISSLKDNRCILWDKHRSTIEELPLTV